MTNHFETTEDEAVLFDMMKIVNHVQEIKDHPSFDLTGPVSEEIREPLRRAMTMISEGLFEFALNVMETSTVIKQMADADENPETDEDRLRYSDIVLVQLLINAVRNGGPPDPGTFMGGVA